MNLQVIQSVTGQNEYVLLPIKLYECLKDQIAGLLANEAEGEYIPFDPANYVQNPVALARIQAHLSRAELAQRLGISISYLGRIERRVKVSDQMLVRVKAVL